MWINCALLALRVHPPYHFGTIFIADDSIGAKSFPREIYFSSRDARKTESKRRVVSTIPPCSPRANFPEYPLRFELFFSDRAPRFRDRILRFPIAAENRENAGDPRGRCIARERETLVSHVSTMLPLRFPFSPFRSFPSLLFSFCLRSSGGYVHTQRWTIFTVLL